MGNRARRIVWGGALALLAMAAPVHAEEPTPAERLKAIDGAIRAHRSAREVDGLVGDVADALALYESTDDKTLRKKALALIGKVSASKKPDDEARAIEAALKAIGKTGDEQGARYVKAWLRQPNPKKAPRHLPLAATTAGQLACASLAAPLLKIYDKSKHIGASRAAMVALGAFGRVKRVREKILTTLVDSLIKNKPGGRPGDRSGMSSPGGDPAHSPSSYGGASQRWAELSPELPKVLNKLTGESFQSVEDWSEVIKDHKGRLKVLFANLDEE